MKRGEQTGAVSAPAPETAKIFTEGFAIRHVVAQGHMGQEPGATMFYVELDAPGAFVTERPCVVVRLREAGGPGDPPHRYREQQWDVYEAGLDRLLATLETAIRIAKDNGVLRGAAP